MTSLFYVALTDGTTTIDLTDGVNYSISDESGWLPNVAFDSEQRTVVDSIPINILGALTGGGRSHAGKTRVNYIKLLTMLRQIERGQQGDGSPVTLVYTSPNSAPARRIACQVTRWDPSTFPADISSVINLPQNEINEVVLTLEHRVPWVWQSYLYTNLLSNSLWATTPTPFSSTGTAAWAATTGYYGGAGLIRLTHTSTGASSITTGDTISVTNGVPVTITYTAGWLTGVTNIRSYLFSGGIIRSDLVDNAVSGSASLTADGQRFTATLTPNFTGTPVIYWLITGVNGNVTEIAEVFVHATVEETWHPDTVDTSLSGTGGAVVPAGTSMTITWPISSQGLAPVDLTLFPQAENSATRAGEGAIIATSGLMSVQNYPQGVPVAPFSSVAGTNAPSGPGNVLRYTPAGTTQVLMPVTVDLTTFINYRYSVWTVLRNISLTTVFQIQPMTRSSANTTYRVAGPKVTILPQATTTDPVPFKIGEVYTNSRLSTLELWVEASAAAGALDISMVAAIEHRDDISEIKYRATDTTGVGLGPALIAYSRWLSSSAPVLQTVNGALSFAVPTITNDMPLIRSRGTTLRVLWLGVSGASWRQTNAAGALVTVGATATRPPAYDAPL